MQNGISLEPVALPLGCAISFIIIQIVVHHASLLGDLRNLINWIFTLIIIRMLCLRKGFLHRFALLAVVIAIFCIPYIGVGANDVYDRVRLNSSIAIANANDLAAWLGFCWVYFLIVAIQTRRTMARVASGLIVVGCLFGVGLTVSRGALLAMAIAGLIASRHLLKRGFTPVFLLVVLVGGFWVSGAFDRAIGVYQERGTEETGRLLVWPLVMQRFLNAPMTGVGLTEIGTYVPQFNEAITPHNSFLYVGVASGIIPLAFFIAYWLKAGKGAYRLINHQRSEGPFCLPLYIYTLIIAFLGAGEFMFSWAVVTLTMVTAAGHLRRPAHGLMHPSRSRPAASYSGLRAMKIPRGPGASRISRPQRNLN
jgi:O-antigen ligase